MVSSVAEESRRARESENAEESARKIAGKFTRDFSSALLDVAEETNAAMKNSAGKNIV